MKLAVFLTIAWVGAASAQQMPMPQDTTTPPPGAVVTQRALRGIIFKRSHEAQDADKAALAKMMDGMNAPYTDDADYDFVTHMIPHHQGAVDMCQTELQYGDDTKIKALCEHIVSNQQEEIKLMQAWLAKHPPRSVYNIPQKMQWK